MELENRGEDCEMGLQLGSGDRKCMGLVGKMSMGLLTSIH